MRPEEIKRRRVALGLTQEELARRLNVSKRSVSRWEQGVVEPLPVVVDAMRKIGRQPPSRGKK